MHSKQTARESYIRAMALKKRFLKKRKVFKKDLKELKHYSRLCMSVQLSLYCRQHRPALLTETLQQAMHVCTAVPILQACSIAPHVIHAAHFLPTILAKMLVSDGPT